MTTQTPRHTTSTAPTVEDAEHELQQAERHLEDVRAKRVLGETVTQAEYTEALGAVQFAQDGIDAARRAEEARQEAERQAQLERLRERLGALDDAALEKARAAATKAVGAYLDALLARDAVLADVRAGLLALGSWATSRAESTHAGVTIGATTADAARPESSLHRLVQAAVRERGARPALHWNPQD